MKQEHGRGRRWAEGAALVLPPNVISPGEIPHNTVYRQLRHFILYSTLPPGAWLRQNELAAQFSVSRTPIREALRTLAREGLVEFIPNYGVRVAALSIEEFEELYALRIGIEGYAARTATTLITDEAIAALEQALQQIEPLAARATLEVYLQQEWRFRVQLYQITGRQRLVERITALREHAERYLRLAYGAEARLSESLGFHQRLLDAVSRRQPELAEQINQDALRWTLRHAGPVIRQLTAPQSASSASVHSGEHGDRSAE